MKKLWLKKYSKIHGIGLFAAYDIKKKSKIIEYIGDKVTKKQGDIRVDKQIDKNKRNKKNGMVYVFELNSRYDIDGDVKHNFARFINHTCDPNCEVEIINNRIWILSIKNIKKGEELSYNYGYSYDTDFKDHPCRCKKLKCMGYILSKDYWHRIKKN